MVEGINIFNVKRLLKSIFKEPHYFRVGFIHRYRVMSLKKLHQPEAGAILKL